MKAVFGESLDLKTNFTKLNHTYRFGRTPLDWDFLNFEGNTDYPWWEYQCWKLNK